MENKIKQIIENINQGQKLTKALRSAGFSNKAMFDFRRTKEYQQIYDYYKKREKNEQLSTRS